MKTIAAACLCASVCLLSCSPSGERTSLRTSSDRYAAEEVPVSQFIWPDGKRLAVSLTFDDARPSQLDAGIPLLNSYGVKATFYVMSERVEERLADWKDVLAAGHEIGNHSLRHPCTGNFTFAREKALEDYTLAQMAAELDEANAWIERLLGIRAATFAYPCGQKYVDRGQSV